MSQMCDSWSQKCFGLCGVDGRYNASWNGQRIVGCIFTRRTTRTLQQRRESFVDRLQSLLAAGRLHTSAAQYQCLRTQYQSDTGAGAPPPPDVFAAAPDDGWEIATAEPPSTVAQADRDTSAAHVLAAVVVHRSSSAPAASAPSFRPAEAEAARRHATEVRRDTPRLEAVAPARAATSADSDWFVRTLVVLMGAAALALFLMAAVEVDGVGRTLTGFRSRIGSRGLSDARIALGDDAEATEARRSEIRYRE
jgi:hypothetical protein